MLIRYTHSKRQISTGFNPGEKVLCTLVRGGMISEEVLCDRITSRTSLAYSDVLSAIAALQEEIVDATTMGITINLSHIGNFTPYLNVKAVDTEEEANYESIKKLKVVFKPNKRFTNKMKSVSYEYVNPVPKGFIDPNATTP